MYCVLKYIDYDEYVKNVNLSLSRTSVCEQAIPNKKLLFNPNCTLQIILDHICKETGIDANSCDFDLCRANGDLVGLKDYKSTTTGLTVFMQREQYCITLFERDSTGQITKTLPMLNRYSDEFATLSSKLTIQSSASKLLAKKKRGSAKSSRASITLQSTVSLLGKSSSKRRASSAQKN